MTGEVKIPGFFTQQLRNQSKLAGARRELERLETKHSNISHIRDAVKTIVTELEEAKKKALQKVNEGVGEHPRVKSIVNKYAESTIECLIESYTAIDRGGVAYELSSLKSALGKVISEKKGSGMDFWVLCKSVSRQKLSSFVDVILPEIMQNFRAEIDVLRAELDNQSHQTVITASSQG